MLDFVRWSQLINSINMSYYNYKSGRNTFKEHDLIKGPLYMTKMEFKNRAKIPPNSF